MENELCIEYVNISAVNDYSVKLSWMKAATTALTFKTLDIKTLC